LGKLFKISIRRNKLLTENHYLLTARPLIKISEPTPGQFFMLSVDNGIDPLLNRPFSLHRWLGEDFQLLYRVVGKATSILKERKPGDILDVIGPLGNGFPVGDMGKKKPVLIAGGIGIAPLMALAETVAKSKPIFFYGARTEKEVLCLNELRSIAIDPVISTDDGTLGKKGVVTDLLNEYLSQDSAQKSEHCLYACGPEPMLVSLSGIARKYKVESFMALEESMACGIGTCLGCVIRTKDGYKRVCKEGPVFSSGDIVW
jgi:dihydroorotate dehydrogenase electron transfer subunit